MEQPRQRGRYDFTTKHEPVGIDLREVEHGYLMSLAENFSDPAAAAALPPHIVADFARRVHLLLADPNMVDERPEAPAPRDAPEGKQVTGVLGMTAADQAATSSFYLPAGAKWDHVRDVNGHLEWTIVPDPTYLPPMMDLPATGADYTISGFGQLEQTIEMACHNATSTGEAQTIDYPERNGPSWSRATVGPGQYAISYQHGFGNPHKRELDALVGVASATELRDAAYYLSRHELLAPDDVPLLSRNVARAFDEDHRAQAEAALGRALVLHPQRTAGLANDLRAAADSKDTRRV